MRESHTSRSLEGRALKGVRLLDLGTIEITFAQAILRSGTWY